MKVDVFSFGCRPLRWCLAELQAASEVEVFALDILQIFKPVLT